MNLTQLKYFQTVCDFNSITKAAEYLHISQPSISSAIKELENEFGLMLFERHHKGVFLTVEGETLQKLAKDILTSVTQAENIMQELGERRKILKLGIPPMISSVFLPQIYNDFLVKNEDISLEIFEGGYSDLLQKLNDDYLDIVFLPNDNRLSKDLADVFITKLELACCVHKDNAIAKLPSVNPNSLKNIPIVLFENSFFQTAKIRNWFESEKTEPKILLQTKQLSTVIKIISENLAVGFMFKQIIDSNPDIVPIPLENQIDINVSLVYKKNTPSFQTMKKFIDYMKNNQV